MCQLCKNAWLKCEPRPNVNGVFKRKKRGYTTMKRCQQLFYYRIIKKQMLGLLPKHKNKHIRKQPMKPKKDRKIY